MVGTMGIYKSLKINIVTVMKNREMLKIFLDPFKTKKMCEHAVKKLPYLLRYVRDQKRLNKCMIKLFSKMLEHKSLFLATTKIKTCVIKQLMINLMH